ncbi:hypothetical protein DCC81_23965 [Chitinophaga parva]|uniref:Uncharacterized protein n=1 Tax=Chitinophaga parva TaxID=2169414 RepID=A0A2T7BEB0_9BACT|nr:hypothetical protein [Chitinophaga parva]PUZ23438.1 hypothetical protein DCC81_23965 [Chitinophaga parva]
MAIETPTSWKDVKLKHFIKILELALPTELGDGENLFEGIDYRFNVLSIITDKPVDYFESLPINESLPMLQTTSFLDTEINVDNHQAAYTIKPIDKVKLSDFILFMNLSVDPYKNMATILKHFIAEDLTEEQINDLDMLTINSLFFCLRQSAKQSIKRSIRETSKTLMKQIVTQKIPALFRRKIKK